MEKIRCKNRQCGNVIALISGGVPSVVCDKCGTVRKLYHGGKTRSVRVTLKAPEHVRKMLARAA